MAQGGMPATHSSGGCCAGHIMLYIALVVMISMYVSAADSLWIAGCVHLYVYVVEGMHHSAADSLWIAGVVQASTML